MTQSALDQELRDYLESEGAVSWATKDAETMVRGYMSLLDFLSDDQRKKDRLLKPLIRNSGFSNDLVKKRTKGNPFTQGVSSKDGKYFSASCIYPDIDLPIGTYAHEATHFLAGYGPKRSRLIKRPFDEPLSCIIQHYFDLKEEPTVIEAITELQGELGATEYLENCERLAGNPMIRMSKHNSETEFADTSIVGLAAYSISLREGDAAARDYIMGLYQEALPKKRKPNQKKIEPIKVREYAA